MSSSHYHALLQSEYICEKKDDEGVQRSTSTLEESLNSCGDGTSYRVHIHWKVNLAEAIDRETTASFSFHGVKPDARRTFVTTAQGKAARGITWEEASNRGHFYCWAPKRGSLYKGTNWKPFADYRVLGKWVEDLWADGKLANDAYMKLSLQVRKGHASRKRDLEVVLADEHDAFVSQRILEVDNALSKLRAPFHVFPEVTAWRDSYLTLNFRWDLLCLCADSASG